MHTILITGAGSGIGKATAISLSKNPNYRLLLVGRTLDKLKDTLKNLKNKDPHIIKSVDVSKKEDIINFLSSEETNLDSHPLVNVFANAGIGGPNVFGLRDRWKEIIDINLTGAYNTCMASYPWLNKAAAVLWLFLAEPIAIE